MNVSVIELSLSLPVSGSFTDCKDNNLVAVQEYYDYIFPDEGKAAPHLKILEAAERWKRQKLESGS